MIANNSITFGALRQREKINLSVSISRMISTFAIVKGTLIAAVTAALGTTFFQSLVVGVVSALIGAAGASIAALIAVHAARTNREILNDIQRNTGTAKREQDDGE